MKDKKKKRKKKFKSAWEEILDYHERVGPSGGYIYTGFPSGWKKPKKHPSRWNP